MYCSAPRIALIRASIFFPYCLYRGLTPLSKQFLVHMTPMLLPQAAAQGRFPQRARPVRQQGLQRPGLSRQFTRGEGAPPSQDPLKKVVVRGEGHHQWWEGKNQAQAEEEEATQSPAPVLVPNTSHVSGFLPHPPFPPGGPSPSPAASPFCYVILYLTRTGAQGGPYATDEGQGASLVQLRRKWKGCNGATAVDTAVTAAAPALPTSSRVQHRQGNNLVARVLAAGRSSDMQLMAEQGYAGTAGRADDPVCSMGAGMQGSRVGVPSCLGRDQLSPAVQSLPESTGRSNPSLGHHFVCSLTSRKRCGAQRCY
ncbi:hypothetical protein ABBQ38_001865 [Trebouxia sp. C0009 RCD-2024]